MKNKTKTALIYAYNRLIGPKDKKPKRQNDGSEEAIRFAAWILKNARPVNTETDGRLWLFMRVTYTTELLYKIYKTTIQ